MEKEYFIKYLENRDLQKKTIHYAVKFVGQFLEKTKKEDLQITKPDVLNFLEYLKNKGLQNASRQIYLFAINHYFAFLYENEKIAKNPCLFLKIRGIQRKKLYKIYTPEELDNLFDAYYQVFVRGYDDRHIPQNIRERAALGKERNALILSILINQGITTAEIDKLELSDIDLIKATVKIRGGKMLNNRNLPLKASQIGLIINYLQNIRPQLIELQKIESNKLFLPLPTSVKNDGTFIIRYQLFTKQVKSIDKQFINFLQVRASVITNWLKTEGLRKAQYLAGHRYISSTETYVNNNLDGLIDDINKLNPFDF